MESLSIRIQTLEDAKVERNVMPEVSEDDVKTAKNLTVCILEDMTTEHKAGVLLSLEMPDGSYVAYNITENLFNGMVASYNGALARFADLREARESESTIAPEGEDKPKGD